MRSKSNILLMKVILASIALLLIAGQALGLGVGPSSQYVSYNPGQTIQGKLTIINNNNEAFKAAVYAQGDLAEYITIPQPLLDVAEGDATKEVPYEINFPAATPTPGEHNLELVVRKFPSGTKLSEGTQITASVAVISQLIVRVPYPGKYLEAKLSISGSEKNETPTRFYIESYNFGTEEISSASVHIDIFNPAMEKIAGLDTTPTPIQSKDAAHFEALWTAEVPKGTYQSTATVKYDDKEVTLEQQFDVGIFVIDVSDISVKKFKLGDVAKFDILLFNSWNRDMKDVYVEMSVEDKAGKKMTEFKTSAIDIPAQQTGSLEAYWYTEGVMPDTYKVKLLVHYAGKVTQKEYDFEVNTNSVTRLGAVGQAVGTAEEKGASSQKVIIALILIVFALLVAMNIAWFYVISKKLKGEGK